MVASVVYNFLSLDEEPYSIVSIEGLLGSPDIRSTDQPYVGRSGLAMGRDFYGGRTVTITLTVYAPDSDQFSFAVDALAAAFAAPRDNELSLTFTIPGVAAGLAARLLCRPRRVSLPIPSLYFNQQAEAVIELFATDPKKYANSPSSFVVSVGVTAGGFAWPFTWPLTWPGSTASAAILTNLGNVPTYPNVRFDGPLTNPAITNLNTGQTVSLTISIATGDWVDLNFANRTVLINGAVNRYPYLDDADWWAIAPGNTTVALTADAGTGTALITWRSAWT